MRRDVTSHGNPVITETYTSDPTVLVTRRHAYLYTGHDEAEPGAQRFVMRDWLCFSSTDLLSWTAHGPLLRVEDFAWPATAPRPRAWSSGTGGSGGTSR